MNDVTFIPNPLVGAEWERSVEARLAVAHVGEEVAAKAKELAPVDTGALRDSIASHMASDAGAAKAEILADVPYAAFVEFGTANMAAEPYLRPALEAVVGR